METLKRHLNWFVIDMTNRLQHTRLLSSIEMGSFLCGHGRWNNMVILVAIMDNDSSGESVTILPLQKNLGSSISSTDYL